MQAEASQSSPRTSTFLDLPAQGILISAVFEIEVDLGGTVNLKNTSPSDRVTAGGAGNDTTITVDARGEGVEFSFHIKDPDSGEWVFDDPAGEFFQGSCQIPVFSVFVSPARTVELNELKIGFKSNVNKDVPFGFKLFFRKRGAADRIVYDPTVILKPPPTS